MIFPHYFLISLISDGELNVLDDILTEVPEQDDELYNPESEQDKNEKKGKISVYFVKITVYIEKNVLSLFFCTCSLRHLTPKAQS